MIELAHQGGQMYVRHLSTCGERWRGAGGLSFKEARQSPLGLVRLPRARWSKYPGLTKKRAKAEPWVAMYLRTQFFGTDDLDTFGNEELSVKLQLQARRGSTGSEVILDWAEREVDFGDETSSPQLRLIDMPLAKFRQVQTLRVFLTCFEQDFDSIGDLFFVFHTLPSFWNMAQVEADAANGKWGLFAASPYDLQAAEPSEVDVCAASQVELRLYPR